jgi:hypothetical protein
VELGVEVRSAMKKEPMAEVDDNVVVDEEELGIDLYIRRGLYPALCAWLSALGATKRTR